MGPRPRVTLLKVVKELSMGSPLLAPLPVILIKNRGGGNRTKTHLECNYCTSSGTWRKGQIILQNFLSDFQEECNSCYHSTVLYITHDQMSFFVSLAMRNLFLQTLQISKISCLVGKKVLLSVGST
jgi:hypothetical protein